MFDIYYQALSKENPEFDDIPPQYEPIIALTLENDILIQSGYSKDLPKLSVTQKLSVRALQKARNKVAADDMKRREEEAARNK